jgi:hypothetical protein
MDPTQPLNILPSPAASPYSQNTALGNVIQALQAGASGYNKGLQPQAQQQQNGQTPGTSAPSSNNTPNYNQFGSQATTSLLNILNNIGGSSPTYGGGNILSGDVSGGSSIAPLPGLTPADYGAGF